VFQGPRGEPLFVVVNGPPGSGKTTLAEELASDLGLPLLSKDAIKEALMDEWEVPDIETSRQLGQAAMTSLIEAARDSPIGAVLEANFMRSLAVSEIRQLQGHVVEVFCRCPRELCLVRYRERSSDRHPGHLDAERSAADIWNDETTAPIAGGWKIVEVDTSEPVDVASLVEEVASA
jgi:predicted kinase